MVYSEAMSMTHLTAQQLHRAAEIREKIENLEKDFAALLAVTGEAPVTVRRRGRPAKRVVAPAPPTPKPKRKISKPAPKRPAKKRAKPGQVKNAILNLLKQSGKKGIPVKEIAGKLGVGVNRIHTWFYNARKSLKQIRKIGSGKYCWQE
jgi:hypothetical protein